MDANTKALNKYQEKLKLQGIIFEEFLSKIDNDLVELQELITKLKKKAENYDGYDFTEELKEIINDTI